MQNCGDTWVVMRIGALILGFFVGVGLVQSQVWPVSKALAATSDWSSAERYKVRLIAAKVAADGAAPRVMVGVEIRLDKGWKTYWRAPGDSGVPPYFDFSQSTNLASAVVHYPAPHRYTDESGDALVYERVVVFPVSIVRGDPTKPVKVKLNVDFGVCEKVCIPASATLSLIVPANMNASGEGALIAKAMEHVPRRAAEVRKSDPKLIGVRVVPSGSGKAFIFKARYQPGSRGKDLFLEAPDGLFIPVPQRLKAAADGVVSFTARLGASDAAALKGKMLTITMVGSAGQAQTHWQVP